MPADTIRRDTSRTAEQDNEPSVLMADIAKAEAAAELALARLKKREEAPTDAGFGSDEPDPLTDMADMLMPEWAAYKAAYRKRGPRKHLKVPEPKFAPVWERKEDHLKALSKGYIPVPLKGDFCDLNEMRLYREPFALQRDRMRAPGIESTRRMKAAERMAEGIQHKVEVTKDEKKEQ